jgi:hypothetical protein
MTVLHQNSQISLENLIILLKVSRTQMSHQTTSSIVVGAVKIYVAVVGALREKVK